MRKLLLIIVMTALSAPHLRAQINADVSRDTTKWFNKTHTVSEITVRAKRSRYSRKNNPAVELMKKVIAAKKRTELEQHDFYTYCKYQKLTFGANNVQPADFTNGLLSKIPGLINQVEVCRYNNKLVLPLTVSETIRQKVYRKNPKKIIEIVKAERDDGINTIIQTGNILTAALKDFFTDVNIYDDQIRLLQHPFTSPIGKDAIRFYRFYIQDTLKIDSDSVIHLSFVPNNQMDFGFRGDIYIVKDSSYQVRRCELSIPKHSEVNFVDGMQILQEFTRTATGEWVLSADDMVVELELFDFMSKAIVIRNTRLTDYSFETLPPHVFKGKGNGKTEFGAKRRNEQYWNVHRKVQLTPGERGIGHFIAGLQSGKNYNIITAGLKLLVENFVETGSAAKPSKIDIGPVNSMVSSNFIDGMRLRVSAQTTANLNRHLFMSGFYARGLKSHKDYYKGEITYSFNKKEYLPHEFPMRNITFTSTYDVCAPTDKFMTNDKDNVFTSLKWTTVDKMMFYNRQQLKLVREEEWGLRSTMTLTAEENEACGSLVFRPLSAVAAQGPPLDRLRTTELRAELRFAPGEEAVSTKQRRRPINRDAPVLTLSHAVGLSGVLGGQYRYNFTEATFFKRFWVKSWGKVDVDLRGGIQWNQVPFPLLVMPAANLSYIKQYSTFSLINNMEFLSDRYASLGIEWDLNGKLFNRIPLIRKLKWREYIGFKTMWSTLTDKNNPWLPQNAASSVLMAFPEGSCVMDRDKPYMEMLVGVHNVFRFFHIEYVHRLNYLHLPTATKHGVRMKFSLKF